jgi:hypothetical protein
MKGVSFATSDIFSPYCELLSSLLENLRTNLFPSHFCWKVIILCLKKEPTATEKQSFINNICYTLLVLPLVRHIFRHFFQSRSIYWDFKLDFLIFITYTYWSLITFPSAYLMKSEWLYFWPRREYQTDFCGHRIITNTGEGLTVLRSIPQTNARDLCNWLSETLILWDVRICKDIHIYLSWMWSAPEYIFSRGQHLNLDPTRSPDILTLNIQSKLWFGSP